MEAVILAGGLGTRLRGVVSDVPKCLAPVAGRPFLDYLAGYLARFPVSRVILSVGYRRELIQDWASGRSFPFEVDFAVEEEPLGTGGGIRLALSRCRERKALILNGDTFYPVDLTRVEADAPVTVALKPMRQFERYGAVDLQDGLVTAFREKAPCAEGLINGGVYAVDRDRLRLDALPERFSFEKQVLEPLSAAGQVAGVVRDDYFIDIGVPEDYARAQRELPEWEATMRLSDALMASPYDCLFLDRDGVVNRLLPGDYVKTWDEFEFLPGMPAPFAEWSRKFRRIILVTNQRGVGKGLMTREALDDIHDRMRAAIRVAGGRLDAILTATGIDDPRRKPAPAMVREACARVPDIRPESSVMVGDADSDRAFAGAAGIAFIRR